MTALSRRVVMSGAVAVSVVPFSEWWEAKAGTVATRHSAFSVEGKQALVSYAKAVQAMRALSENDPTDPLGWLYQYKMHWFPDNGIEVFVAGGLPALEQAQKEELDKVFGSPSPSNVKRAQADATWGKCPHSLPALGGLNRNFLPWHRMYLFFFERIVRKLSGDDNFSLPYWGYMDGASSQLLPPEFRTASSNPLFHDRNPALAQGGALDSSAFIGEFWNDPVFDVFTLSAESTPHGNIHNNTGIDESVEPNIFFDMSSLFTSPRDPIFWLHHCEIDRIWAGAIKAGFGTPGGTWPTQKFNFFDEDRTFIEIKNGDVLNTEQLATWPGYTYKELPQPPSTAAPMLMAEAPQQTARRTLAESADVKLRGGLEKTELAPTPALPAATAAPLAPESSRRIRLEISEISLDKRVVANVGLYLNPPADAKGEELRKYLIGTVPTFSILPTAKKGDHAGHGEEGAPAVLTFDVTRAVVELQKQGLWKGEPQLVTKEVVGSLGGATLELGKVELVEIGITGGQQ